ncbi:hypothetical protein [Entomospira culicis]|uniref:hypothetical protein n=1 Tax=Entomospira culicis TaxID=2719989 RepID=UPI001BB06F11|nr:hypothetical protein [Entomospira culicis]
MEWGIYNCEEDESLTESCVCGKENLRYLYTIINRITNYQLHPIGSVCIKKFKRGDLNAEIAINEQLFKILKAVENKEYISLDSKYFSKKLLRYFYDNDVFQKNSYNNGDAYNDYIFLLNIFNKRNKDNITANQHKKINALILNNIKPYLKQKLSIRKKSL